MRSSLLLFILFKLIFKTILLKHSVFFTSPMQAFSFPFFEVATIATIFQFPNIILFYLFFKRFYLFIF